MTKKNVAAVSTVAAVAKASPAAHATAHVGHGDSHGHGHGHGTELHLPHGSIWPFLLAMAMALVGVGALFLPSPFVLLAGIAFLGVALAGWITEDHKWWRDLVGTSPTVARAGLLLFISSEVFIFGALFATYFTFQSQSSVWPDAKGLHLPWVNTGIFSLFLFASSGTIHMAEKHIKHGNKKGFHVWWLATIVLGAIFLTGQVIEYIEFIHAGHTLGSSQFMTAFYMLTGTHGAHVAGGLVYLIIVFLRSLKGHFTAERHVAPQTAAMYWHFVDIVWVFVYSILYLLNL